MSGEVNDLTRRLFGKGVAMRTVTPVCEAGPCNFTPGAISRAMIGDYSAGVRSKQKAA